MKYLSLIVAFLFITITLNAQTLPSEEQILARAAEYGITQADIEALNLERDDVIRRIISKGVNLQDQAAVERAALEVYREELDKRKNDISPNTEVLTPTQDTTDKVTKEANATITIDEKKDADVLKIIPKVLEEEMDKTNESSAVYGQNIFSEIALYIDPKTIKPKDSYVIGSGDEFYVTVYGRREGSLALQVNTDGYIQSPGVIPRTYLKGMTYGKAKKVIIDRVSNVYNLNRANVEVGLSYARTVSIDIMGEVKKPGNYLLPGVNSAFNALVASSGLNEIGSVRKIKLVRSGEAPKTIDIYKYLNNPTEGENFYLQDNDIIVVPTLGRTIRIEGQVYKPNTFELIEGENLLKLLEYAGGVRANAYKQSIRITRVVNDKRELINVNLAEALRTGRDFTLMDGDAIEIKTVSAYNQDFITLTGAFLYEDNYEYQDGYKVSDLLSKGILQPEAKTDTAYVIRTAADNSKSYIRINIDNILNDNTSADNIALQPKDEIIVPKQTEYYSQFAVSVVGEVRKDSTKLVYDKSLTIRDLIYLSGGLKNSAANIAYLVRSLDDGQTEYQKVNLREILDVSNPSNNEIKVMPNDVLRVFDKKYFKEKFTIQISGAVNREGVYTYDNSLSLEDVLYLAGGVKREGANSFVEVSRIQINPSGIETDVVVATLPIDANSKVTGSEDFQLEPNDQIFVRSAADYEEQQNVLIFGEVNYKGKYSLTSTGGETVYDLIKRAGGLTREALPKGATLERNQGEIGLILLDLNDVLTNPETSPYNYKLKEGDVIFVPRASGLVSIEGAIENPLINQDGNIFVPFLKGKNAKYYIKEFGDGVDRKKDGRNRLIAVTYPNGDREQTINLGLFNIYPKVEEGSVITVGRRPIKVEEEKEKQDIDWEKIIDNTVTRITAVLTIFVLIQQGLNN